MKIKIGKRYKWSPYKSGKDKWMNGVLERTVMICGVGYGIFVTRDNESWQIPLDDVEEY